MKETILRLITGQLTKKEEMETLDMVGETYENKEDYYRFLNLWALSSQKGQYKKADQTDIDNFKRQIQKKRTGYNTQLTIFLKYAAIVISAVFLGRFIFPTEDTVEYNSLSNQITVPLGSKSSLTLPDGTEVVLNAGSKLTYDYSYGITSREVSLVGEGYFKVAKNKDNPFIVITTKARIKALGTEFNVKAYPDENTMEAILVEGSIQVQKMKYGTGEKIEGKAIVLKPGQKILISDKDYNLKNNGKPHKETEFSIEKAEIADIDIETSWKDDRWIIQGEPLDQLAVLLARRYNISIQLHDKELTDYRFSATIQNETIEQIFSIMKLAIPMTYTIDKGKVTWFFNHNLEKDYNEVYKK